MIDVDAIPAEVPWHTVSSHPAGKLAYQEAETAVGVLARVTEDGYEVVTPTDDVVAVYGQYWSRIDSFVQSVGEDYA